MAFNFGANNNNNNQQPQGGPPPPAPSFGGFGGSSSTPAPASGSTPAPASAFGGFGGSSTPAPAATSTPAPAFGGFGSSSTNAPASSTTPAPAPAFGGFGGSTTTTNTPAPAPGSTSAPAPPPAFGFGGSSTTTPAPAPQPGTTTTTTPGATPRPHATITMPQFDSTFENIDVWSKVRQLCSGSGKTLLAGEDLKHYVSTNATTSLKPQAVEWTQPNNALRQQLAQNPTIGVDESDPTKTTTLSRDILEQILLLSTDLRISEPHAATLYAEVSSHYETISGLISTKGSVVGDSGSSIIDMIQSKGNYNHCSKLASKFYFYERHLKLESILYLVESREQKDPDIIMATDSLLKNGQLVPNLISLVREYTQRIQMLQQEILTTRSDPAFGGGIFPGQQQQQQQPSFAQVHLMFYVQERQAAVETLFFVAYSTQLEPSEVESLIDIIRDLSQGAPKPSPFTDVPSAYESSGGLMNQPSWPGSSSNFSWQPKMKNQLQWQNELVQQICESGQTDLMQCIALLVSATVTAMDTKQTLLNRDLHGPNAFGEGNQLLPPNQLSFDNIQGIHSRLSHDTSTTWARPDIWGILASSYALLLRSKECVAASPAKGGAHGHVPKEFREASRQGMDAPREQMSFAFCRLTMIPALSKLSTASLYGFCDTSEFSLSVIAEYYARYLEESTVHNILPTSRKKWQTEKEEDLELEREQEKQKQQFEYWAGNTSHTNQKKIASSVDFMTRYECLDDYIALATTICSLGPEYSQSFWGTDQESGSPTSSKALEYCLYQAIQDDSLTPSVVSWLAALANNEVSANIIYEWMMERAPEDTSAQSVKMNWRILIHNLRWYAQELSPGESTVSKSSTSTRTSNANTSYYYDIAGTSSYGSAAGVDSSQARRSEGSSSSSSKSKPKELSASSTFMISSHLALIRNVSLHCQKARRGILSVTLPVQNGGLLTGEDPALVVLFKLALAPLTPQIRGATLSAIASLFHPTDGISDPETKKFLDEQGRNAWDYVESCPLLPIALLDRYRLVNPGALPNGNPGGISFPPSSMTLASTDGDVNTVLPKDPKYGLLFEMEHIESKKGWYPATEGFLELLNALICAVGCPTNLGEDWRPRTGCTPYLEYVINFVLPRALGVDQKPVLPFRLLGDQSRLVSRALSVVESVIIRYNIPPAVLKISPGPSPVTVLGIQTVAEKVNASSCKTDPKVVEADFKNLTTTSSVPQSTVVGSNAPSTPVSKPGSETPVPVPKSPGFTVLFEVLSSSCGVLLNVLAKVLTEFGGPDGIRSVLGQQSDNMALAYSLFGSTPPTSSSAKEGEKEKGPTMPLQNLLKPLFPRIDGANVDELFFDDSVFWRESSVVSAFSILCAAAAREDSFIAALKAVQQPPLKLVPALRFEQMKPGAGNYSSVDPRAVDVKVSRLADLFFSVTKSREVRSTTVQYIGYDGSNGWNDSMISASALSLVYRMQQSISHRCNLRDLCGEDTNPNVFSKAVSSRLLISAKNLQYATGPEILGFILNWILNDLRQGVVVEGGVTEVLLGLPDRTKDGNWKPGHSYYSGAVGDCFDAILDILTHEDIVMMSPAASEVASLCYEVFFRLYDFLKGGDTRSMKISIYTAERLRSVSFWKESIMRLRRWDISVADTKHAISWLLKGLASELRLLVGFAEDVIRGVGLANLEPRPALCKGLMTELYGSGEAIVNVLIENLDLELVNIDPTLTPPPNDALKISSYTLPGPSDVVQGYEILDIEKALAAVLASAITTDTVKAQQWMQEWNAIAIRYCAVSHLTDAISILIDASLYSADFMKGQQLDFVTRTPGYDSWLHSGGAEELLDLILRKLDISHIYQGSQGLDSFLLPTATRNLSNAVLVLSEFISSLLSDGLKSPSDIVNLGVQVSSIVDKSSVGDDTADGTPIRYGRTVTLGCALAKLLRYSAPMERSIVQQHQNDFARAAHGLARLSCFPVVPAKNDENADNTQARGTISVVSRASLASLVLAVSDDTSSSSVEHSFVYTLLRKPFVDHLCELVLTLDEDVCNFLQVVSMQPFGAEILISGGIDRALAAAASNYVQEESAASMNIERSGLSYEKTTIRAPTYLLGHLKLMCSLLSPTHDQSPTEFRQKFAILCLEILVKYRNIITRLCYNFPAQADVTRWVLKCMVLGFSVVQPIDDDISHDILSDGFNSRFKHIFVNAGFMQNGISLLIEQIAENPLPRDMIPANNMPPELRKTRDTGSSSVTIEKEDSGSWWDVLDKFLSAVPLRSDDGIVFDPPIGRGFFSPVSEKKWNQDMFEYAVVASDILFMGLNLATRSDQLRSINTSSLARGLLCTSFAAGSVGRRSDEVSMRSKSTFNSMDTDDQGNLELESEYLSLLASSLGRCTEEILVTLLMMCDVKENGRDAKKIKVAIDASGIGSSTSTGGLPKESQELSLLLCNQITKEIK